MKLLGIGTLRKKIFPLVFAALLLLPVGIQPAFAAPVLYGSDGSGNNPSTLYTINTASGVATPVGSGIGFNGCGAMDFHPVSGILYAICRDATTGANVLITINHITGIGAFEQLVTGSIASVVGQQGSGGVMDVSFRNSDNTLFVTTLLRTGFSQADLHTIDISTGFSTLLGNLVTATAAGNGIAFSPTDTLFHIDFTNFNTLNQATGFATIIATPVTHSQSATLLFRENAMDFEPGTGVLFASTNDGTGGSGPNFISTVNTATGLVTIIAQTVNGLDAIAFLPDVTLIGGTIFPIDTTTLLLVGAQMTAAWMIPVIIAGIGIAIVITRKF